MVVIQTLLAALVLFPVTVNGLKGRNYTETSIREYVSYTGSTFVTSGTPTEYIRVTETVSNAANADVVTLWTILPKDFYDPTAQSTVRNPGITSVSLWEILILTKDFYDPNAY